MSRCVLVTGAAKRIGAEIVRTLHAAGYRIVLHFRGAQSAALDLREELNQQRPESVEILQADLRNFGQFPSLVERSISIFGRIDCLINNASVFYPTRVDQVTESEWDEMFECNLKAPFFLSLAFAPELNKRNGSVINLSDIHGLRPLKGYSIYSLSKAGLNAMTHSLARELAPSIRVNAVAPGAILWPENEMDEDDRAGILSKIALARSGTPEDIGKTVLFLLESPYLTGQIIAVDGGRGLYT